MTLCTICCRCGRWYYGPNADPKYCLGNPKVNPKTNQWFYNPCGHVKCTGCGEGDFPLPCEGEPRVTKGVNVTDRAGLVADQKKKKRKNRKKKRPKNRNR